jgi:hypothetical protein
VDQGDHCATLGNDVGKLERPDLSDTGKLPEVLHDRLLAPEQPADGVVVRKRVPPLDVLAQRSQQRTAVVPVERFVGLANPARSAARCPWALLKTNDP